MKICSVICGAPCDNLPVELVEGLIVAADRGLDHCLKAGITPHCAVGDFDSARYGVPEGVEHITAPAEKDETDALLAVNVGLERGCSEFRLFCALGGRLDHSFANLQTLLRLRKMGKFGTLYGDGCEAVFALNETVRVARFLGYLSVFAFEEEAKASISGAKYNVLDYDLKNTFPIGVSNEVVGDFAQITASGGAVLIIKQNYDN